MLQKLATGINSLIMYLHFPFSLRLVESQMQSKFLTKTRVHFCWGIWFLEKGKTTYLRRSSVHKMSFLSLFFIRVKFSCEEKSDPFLLFRLFPFWRSPLFRFSRNANQTETITCGALAARESGWSHWRVWHVKSVLSKSDLAFNLWGDKFNEPHRTTFYFVCADEWTTSSPSAIFRKGFAQAFAIRTFCFATGQLVVPGEVFGPNLRVTIKQIRFPIQITLLQPSSATKKIAHSVHRCGFLFPKKMVFSLVKIGEFVEWIATRELLRFLH